jgi:hypothetical protein
MNPYRETSPEPECQCATGPLFDAEDDYGENHPVCGPCIDRRTTSPLPPEKP